MVKEKPKIFLSYAREDMSMAEKLYNDLKRYGLEVWLDTESRLPGDKWKDKIQEAIEHSNYFIALLSSRSVNKKGFVQKELKTALEVLDLFPSSERFILPVRLDDCEVGERKLKEHHWIDLFPEDEYQSGMRKILQVISPRTFLLRSKPIELTDVDVNEMIIRHGFYENARNPGGKGFSHKYKLQEIKSDKVIFDELSCLMWQQGGSSIKMKFEDAKKYIEKLNQNNFAGFNDWRLPTLEEAMSLIEPEIKNQSHISKIFDDKQERIWTADQYQVGLPITMAWVIYFGLGSCTDFFSIVKFFVRAVRSGQASE